MTSASLQAQDPALLPITQPEATAAPRKRRRRTGGSGAGDDCFACRKRLVKCDRKRPYCSQCIEIGKECSGYKTTLTWGVGVASRGKLRGLSYPVASSEVPSTSSSGQPETRRRKSSVSARKDHGNGSRSSLPQLPLPTSLPPPQQSQFSSQALQTLPIPVPRARDGWHNQNPFNERAVPLHIDTNNNYATDSLSYPRHDETSLTSPFEHGRFTQLPASARSYAETEYATPLEWPNQNQSSPFSHTYASSDLHQDSYRTVFSDNMGSTGLSDSVVRFDEYLGQTSRDSLPQLGAFASDQSGPGPDQEYGAEMISNAFDDLQFEYEHMYEDKPENEQGNLIVTNSRFANPFSHLSLRMQTLMDYYDRNVCPFLVAFDSPENPYRKHVLHLALQNEGLQNAIAALATNNMRMRAKTPKQIGFVHEVTGDFDNIETAIDPGPTAEEAMYKQISIEQLNFQLTGLRAARDDSVLATLLILCLFHVCDSGFSKFKTQLAGVQKLLSFRNGSNRSGFEGWVEMFFTWFDVMTSTVNDREMQMRGESLDMLDFSANLGALEEFSGCDGRLFKLIARLGRLNLLAQGRPVRERAEEVAAGSPQQAPYQRSFSGRKLKPSSKARANGSVTARDFDKIDGNGWGTTILSSDEDAEGSADDEARKGELDDREAFWREWGEIRSRLETWQMDITSLPTPPNGSAPDLTCIGPEHRDLMHINEAFRYSALLYTERLGQPMLPSSSPNFQDLVAKALYHITALPITSCVNKFLLWPLFIAGTECVDEGHRSVIRTRCIEVQRESGFYNNLSGLEVLERVWKEVGTSAKGGEAGEIKSRRRDSQARQDGRYGQAFRWRRAMDRVDGEYILI